MSITFDGDTVTIAIPDRDVEVVAHFAITSVASPIRVHVSGHACVPDRRDVDVDFLRLAAWEVDVTSALLDQAGSGTERDGLRTALAALTFAVDQWATPARIAAIREAITTPWDREVQAMFTGGADS